MAQFAVHRNDNPGTRMEIPFLLDVQADLLDALATRMVVPLYRAGEAGPPAMTRLTPRLRFQGLDLIAMVPEMAGVPGRSLGEALGDLSANRNDILGALDLLLTGC